MTTNLPAEQNNVGGAPLCEGNSGQSATSKAADVLTSKNRVSHDKLTSAIAWFEADDRPNPVNVTRGDMAGLLRELQERRDAEQFETPAPLAEMPLLGVRPMDLHAWSGSCADGCVPVYRISDLFDRRPELNPYDPALRLPVKTVPSLSQTSGFNPAGEPLNAEKCEHGIPRRFCTAVHNRVHQNCASCTCAEPL